MRGGRSPMDAAVRAAVRAPAEEWDAAGVAKLCVLLGRVQQEQEEEQWESGRGEMRKGPGARKKTDGLRIALRLLARHLHHLGEEDSRDRDGSGHEDDERGEGEEEEEEENRETVLEGVLEGLAQCRAVTHPASVNARDACILDFLAQCASAAGHGAVAVRSFITLVGHAQCRQLLLTLATRTAESLHTHLCQLYRSRHNGGVGGVGGGSGIREQEQEQEVEVDSSDNDSDVDTNGADGLPLWRARLAIAVCEEYSDKVAAGQFLCKFTSALAPAVTRDLVIQVAAQDFMKDLDGTPEEFANTVAQLITPRELADALDALEERRRETECGDSDVDEDGNLRGFVQNDEEVLSLATTSSVGLDDELEEEEFVVDEDEEEEDAKRRRPRGRKARVAQDSEGEDDDEDAAEEIELVNLLDGDSDTAAVTHVGHGKTSRPPQFETPSSRKRNGKRARAISSPSVDSSDDDDDDADREDNRDDDGIDTRASVHAATGRLTGSRGRGAPPHAFRQKAQQPDDDQEGEDEDNDEPWRQPLGEQCSNREDPQSQKQKAKKKKKKKKNKRKKQKKTTQQKRKPAHETQKRAKKAHGSSST